MVWCVAATESISCHRHVVIFYMGDWPEHLTGCGVVWCAAAMGPTTICCYTEEIGACMGSQHEAQVAVRIHMMHVIWWAAGLGSDGVWCGVPLQRDQPSFTDTWFYLI